jgi:lipopolysaccharide export system protein LptC
MLSYSSVIRTLRIAVPALGVLLLVLFFLWPTLTAITLPKLDKAQITGDRTELVNPRYEGQDEDGQRFVLTAERAIQTRNKPDEVILISPHAALTQNDNSEGANVTADNGIYENVAEHLNLSDNVQLRTPEGDAFTTAAAAIDLKNKIVSGNVPVTGSGMRIDLSAQGFVYDHAQKLLTLTGPAKLVLKETNEAPIDPPAVAPAN